ncbi:hypothetical protein QJS66_13070 [Kocuria rhizophila]|nr:hypothetical protein QJS66_13070 [Kocuria rhizophila]
MSRDGAVVVAAGPRRGRGPAPAGRHRRARGVLRRVPARRD